MRAINKAPRSIAAAISKRSQRRLSPLKQHQELRVPGLWPHAERLGVKFVVHVIAVRRLLGCDRDMSSGIHSRTSAHPGKKAPELLHVQVEDRGREYVRICDTTSPPAIA